MHITFYHPNSKNTGSAANWFVGRDNNLFLKITKQVSWDEGKRIGSFFANTKNPETHVMLKFSQVEIGNLLLFLEKGTPFKSMHKSKDRTISFNFDLYKKETITIGTSWSIFKTPNDDSTKKSMFGIALNIPETTTLKYFLIEALKKSFEALEDTKETATPKPEAEVPSAPESEPLDF